MALGAYVAMFTFAGVVSLMDPVLYYIFFSKVNVEIEQVQSPPTE